MQDDGISVNKNALENAKIHILEKNMHGLEAALCSGPDEDLAHVAVVCAKEIKEQRKRGCRASDSNPRPPGWRSRALTNAMLLLFGAIQGRA